MIVAALSFALALCVSAATTFALVPRLLPMLRRRAMDRPNVRSSHRVPTPRGGGIAVCIGVLTGSVAAAAPFIVLGANPVLWTLALPLGAAGGLALLSWRDDVSPLPASLRFGAQGLAVLLGLVLMAFAVDVPGGAPGPVSMLALGLGLPVVLPWPLDLALAWFGWMWLVNATNFMDGIDGITVADVAPPALSLPVIALLGVLSGDPTLQAGSVAPMLLACLFMPALGGAMLGFLPFNRPPAHVFLGDVGSVPAGYLTGFALLSLCLFGLGPSALILPAYPLADATWTLLKRARRGERVWEAHREHAYQRAAAAAGHGPVSALVARANVGLALLAAMAIAYPWPALVGAAILTLGLLLRLEATARAEPV